MLYLVIHPQSDYEMFNEGGVGGGIRGLESRIIEADHPDDALMIYIKKERDEVTSDNCQEYFCIPVNSKKCFVASKTLITVLHEKELIDKEELNKQKELKELERLQKKYGK